MLCYKDMTFCPYWRECANGKTCIRAITDAVVADAARIGLGICQFTEKPECFVEKEGE